LRYPVVKRLTGDFLQNRAAYFMPTLQDVADLAGVSTATVSKVLSNTPYVSEATRRKVLEAVREIGYQPNLAARALSSGRTHIIAVAFPYIFDAIFKDPLVMHILEGVESVCTDRQYNLLLSTPHLGDDGVDAHYQQLLQSGYIEGVITIDNVRKASLAAAAAAWQIPAVVIGYHEAEYHVRSDDRAGGEMLMQAVLSARHTGIGLISVPSGMNIAIDERMTGLKQAADSSEMDFDTLPCTESDFSVQGGADSARHLLENHPDLSALICLNDRMAIGAIRELRQMGYRVPQDISVVGYDNISLAGASTPPLTTIDQQAVLQGRKAAELLFDVLNDNSPSSVVLTPQLIERGSLARR
jgi:DNA-binding LacI/PurR family transcriptional regulator